MYLDYDSFVDCLIKSEYKKISSDLVREWWTNDIVILSIRHIDYKVIDEIKMRGMNNVE